jgi:hypothetical protein
MDSMEKQLEEIMFSDFLMPGIAIVLTLVGMFIFYHGVVIPPDLLWLNWLILIVMATVSATLASWVENYICTYSDAENLRCRIFGHKDKSLGMQLTVNRNSAYPRELSESMWHECERCGHKSGGWMRHYLTYGKDDIHWKINLFG